MNDEMSQKIKKTMALPFDLRTQAEQIENVRKRSSDKTNKLVDEILKIIKENKPTYEEAYVSLYIASEVLQHESNFVVVD